MASPQQPPSGTPIDDFPLFPLDMVLLPGEKTILHIFEQRYRDLAVRCIENDEPFGLVLADGSEGYREFGCATRFGDVLERYEDGRLNVIVEGLWPLRVIDESKGFSYRSATVERLADEPASPGDDDQATLARKAFKVLVEAMGMDEIEPEELKTLGAFEMAGRLSLDDNDKQALLETRSEGDRLSLLERVFAEAAGQAVEARKLANIAKSNGHARR